jgi:hypothetical protein
MFLPLDVPTSLPSSVNEYFLVTGTDTSNITNAEAMAKATSDLRMTYAKLAEKYVSDLVRDGRASPEAGQATLDRIAQMTGIFKDPGALADENKYIDTGGGYYGKDLPLFDAVRRAGAEQWSNIGYTDVSKGRGNFPYLYEGYRTQSDIEKAYSWRKGGATREQAREAEEQRRAAKAGKTPARSVYVPSASAYKPTSYTWDWRRLAPPTRWLTY